MLINSTPSVVRLVSVCGLKSIPKMFGLSGSSSSVYHRVLVCAVCGPCGVMLWSPSKWPRAVSGLSDLTAIWFVWSQIVLFLVNQVLRLGTLSGRVPSVVRLVSSCGLLNGSLLFLVYQVCVIVL